MRRGLDIDWPALQDGAGRPRRTEHAGRPTIDGLRITSLFLRGASCSPCLAGKARHPCRIS